MPKNGKDITLVKSRSNFLRESNLRGKNKKRYKSDAVLTDYSTMDDAVTRLNETGASYLKSRGRGGNYRTVSKTVKKDADGSWYKYVTRGGRSRKKKISESRAQGIIRRYKKKESRI